jgi:ubiquinone/menaquinone biosynthesis C-methylase UbiE
MPDPMDAARVKAFFEDVAADWDEMRLDFYDERVIEQLAEQTRLDETKTVVDVGTGTGFVAAGLAPRVRQVVALDLSPAMLETARDNLRRLKVDNVDLREADIHALPLADDSVDAAVANMVLHHAQDPVVMLAEMARVTRPGGWVAITDEVEHPYEWMRTEHADVWLGFSESQVEGFFADARLEHYGYAPLGMQ